PYEMAFNAKINLAGAYDVSMGNSSEIVKELMKMLKDDKNIDYHDQIYYALGSVSMKEEKIGEAIELYKQSVAGSISNTNQKGLSYLSLADIYFERKDYKFSQAYYDSAVTTLNKSYPGYESIAAKTGNLTRFIKIVCFTKCPGKPNIPQNPNIFIQSLLYNMFKCILCSLKIMFIELCLPH
ncbi:unnamed protein product, partial [marine sediment metagenome]